MNLDALREHFPEDEFEIIVVAMPVPRSVLAETDPKAREADGLQSLKEAADQVEWPWLDGSR